jgi:alpha-tubulin suppressor-like RCC1 family protein
VWRVDGAHARLVCVLVAIGSCLYASTGTAFARHVKPVISVFGVAPKSVPSEGTVSVTLEAGDEAGAVECTVSAKPAVTSLPTKVPCSFAGEEGPEPFEFPLEMPANTGRKPLKYKLELTARAAGGKAKAKAKATVTVAPGPARPTATDIDTDSWHTCALLSTDHVDCWGYNETGDLGNGTTADSLTPIETTGITDAGQLGGGGSSCALLPTEHIDCWGYNGWGQLGDSSTGPETCERNGYQYACSRTPVEVTGITDATQIGVGGLYFACALLSSDHVDCWGFNRGGQLGDGSDEGPEKCNEVITCSRKPVEVVGITDAAQVTAGDYFACALLQSGHVKCWGEGQEGELGDGTYNGSDTPVEVKGITDATQVTAGGSHACALLSTGRVECWGDNEFGELGDGTIEFSDTPVETKGLPAHVKEVSAGDSQVCAILSDGDAACWGENGTGQLGDGISTGPETCPLGQETRSCSKIPVLVGDINDITQVAAGEFYTCALRSTQHVYCWGENGLGQLGDGSTTNSDTPVEVAGI